MELDVTTESKLGKVLAGLVHQRLIRRTESAAEAQLQIFHAATLPNENVGFGQEFKALLATHACKITQHRRIRPRTAWAVTIEIDSIWHDAYTGCGKIQPPLHQLREVMARCHEQIDVLGTLGNDVPGGVAVRGR